MLLVVDVHTEVLREATADVPVRLGTAVTGLEDPAAPRVTFSELVEIMVDADVAALEDQLAGKVTR